MRLDKFTLKGQEAIEAAISLAEKSKHQQVEPEHLLSTLLEQAEGIVKPVLEKIGVNVATLLNEVQVQIKKLPSVEGGQQYFSPRLNNVFSAAQKEADQMGDAYVSTEHLLLALSAEKDAPAGKMLRQHGVNRDDLMKVIEQLRGGTKITDQDPESKYQALSKYGRDLTEAESGNRAGNANRAYRLASGIQYRGADAAGSRHRFLIVKREALPLDFLKFPAKLHHVHYGFLRGGLEGDRAQYAVFDVIGEECREHFAQRSGMQRPSRSHSRRQPEFVRTLHDLDVKHCILIQYRQVHGLLGRLP